MSAGNNFRFITCSVLLIFSYFAENVANEPTPIVMWHGMGDSCCAFYSLGAIKEKLNASIPGVYVHSLKIGDNFLEDVENGYFMHPDSQIEMACEKIQQDSQLANGFNAIGFSQGAQFLRALVQRCPTPRIKNLISVGGQHQGVYGLPNCGALSNNACDYIRKLLNHAAYIDWVQKGLVQATYWHDPLNEEEYKKNSSFLADINNELVINETYKTNLLTKEWKVDIYSMSKLRVLFRTVLEKHPIIGNSVVYGTLCVAAEASQQTINKKILNKPSQPLDLETIGRYGIYGTGIGGPLLAVWYRYLDKKLPGATAKVVVKKMLIDQFLFTPQLLVIFYVTMSILEHKEDLLAECKSKFAHTFLANCLFWLPGQAINFSLVPSIYRVTYVGTCSFAWISILCWLKRQDVASSKPDDS
ncbi:palmitoyl-protein thioesterase 1 isoform X1 [Dendroctonus ponderosae]|nr:palmitoyl-protein thioesterase 1 isoform X1 [Dendroctonus ponderosae]